MKEKTNQLNREEAKKLHQKYGTDWICPVCHSSMYIVMKLIKHPLATKKKFPSIFRCILCDREEKYWVSVKDNWLLRLDNDKIVKGNMLNE